MGRLLPDGVKSVCLYCGASNAARDEYKALARVFGQRCAQNGLTLVYGGSIVGLMGVAADAALAEGGTVRGVIPEFLSKHEAAHYGLTELHVTKSMQERQAKMADLSDGFVMLPGGLGSLAEFFEIITWKQLGLHDKPIFVLNYNGYWDGLPAMLANAQKDGFIREDLEALFTVVSTVEEIFGEM